jgi:DNA-binding transcriptional MerR regulator
MIDRMLAIGEIARRAGVQTSTLRYYERIGLLPPPARESGRRRYRVEVLDRLTVIRFARECGFTLREIRKLFAGRPYSSGLRTLAAAKVDELDQLIQRAHAMQQLLQGALRCNCLSLDECGRRIRAARSRRGG